MKAMNDNLCAEGLVPSALVLGEFHSISTRSEAPVKCATLEDRCVVSQTAPEEMVKFMGKHEWIGR